VLGWADLPRGLGPGGAPIPAYRATPVDFSGADGAPRAGAPALGEHTGAVLRELGIEPGGAADGP
jgi:crotonobetainyl-CoA:carnitine CoA-transferase CaiB-like acyl-CoA transferase